MQRLQHDRTDVSPANPLQIRVARDRSARPAHGMCAAIRRRRQTKLRHWRIAMFTKIGRLLAVSSMLVGVACTAAPGDGSVEGEPGSDDTTTALTGQSIVSYHMPYGFQSSTGNLYWTSNETAEFGPSVSTVWRAGKGNTPGSELALYSETNTGSSFGSLVYANPGTWYGYFVASYGGSRSVIKRVPLGGGAATTLATSPAFVGGRDLVTDGVFLFWADDGGLRRMPIGGGPITTMVTSTSITHVQLAYGFVHYSEINQVRRIPTTGGTNTADVVAGSVITAFYVDAPSATIYWGERSGAVRSQDASGSGARYTIHQFPISGREVTTVGFDGSRVLWADCVVPNNNQCAVKKKESGRVIQVAWGEVSAAHLQWDSASMFWGYGNGLLRYGH
jgi:hypothetical protein